jgi:putative endopeptidase
MKSRSLLVVAIAAGCGSHPAKLEPGASAAQHGVYVADLDRSADPCTDFFAYANGTWRQGAPDPGVDVAVEQALGGRREPKDRLKEILDEVSARRDWPTASVEQRLGDFHGGCMDQARIVQRGIEPLKPLGTAE